MIVRSLMLLSALASASAGAQTRSAKAAEAFKLDGLTPPPPPPATPTSAPPASAAEGSDPTTPAASPPTIADGAPAAAPPVATESASTSAVAATSTKPGLRATFTLDTPIGDLIADPAARAVLDKDLPGLSTDQNLDKFVKLGLRQFQPLTGGQLTNAMLVTVAGDLSRLSGPMLAPIAPTVAGASRRNRDTSR